MDIKEIALQLAHRKCTRYDHVPVDRGIRYSFSDAHLIAFAEALAEQIEQETADACAKACANDESGRDSGGYFAEVIRSEAWREYKK